MGAAVFHCSLEGVFVWVLCLIVSIGAAITAEVTCLQGVTMVVLTIQFSAVKNLSEEEASPQFLPSLKGEALCLAQGLM